MKKYTTVIALSILGGLSMHAQIKYPATEKKPQDEKFFDTTITENYRWLEDENSEMTKQWVQMQNRVTFEQLEKIPMRTDLNKRLRQIWNYEKMSAPFTRHGKIFFYKNDGLQNQSVLYIQNGLASMPELLLDPNTQSKDGTTALTMFEVDKAGKYAVIGWSDAGSDWTRFQVMDLDTRKMLNETLYHIKFSGASWYKNGFFYSRYDVMESGKELTAKNNNQKVYYHKLGSSQAEDSLVYEDPKNASGMFGISATEDEKYLVLSTSESTSGNKLYYKKADDPKAKWTRFYDTYDQDAHVLDHAGGKLYIYTNAAAPKGKVIAIDPAKPEKPQDILPAGEHVLTSAQVINGYLVAQYLADVKSAISVHNLNGKKLYDVQLPGAGMASGFNGENGYNTAYFSFTSFIQPSMVFQIDLSSGAMQEYWKPQLPISTDAYETRQVFYTSKDGTRIPMFITCKKGLKLDGNNPVYLYGYGGFNISVTPAFTPHIIPFLDKGGIYAVANIRGGGEYGKEWHEAGTRLKKQNVFDDFIAAAEYLIREKYTNNKRIAISGRSNGGLLVGACMTQRPDLFKVALPGVGVLDMLHYHQFTIGYAWATDYGRSDHKEEFKALIKYSPLHNVKKAEYPATLVVTADHDDRVVPAHSYKFISELQAKQQGNNPVLIRIDVNAGHGAGKPTSKLIDEWVDIWAFTMFHLGVK